MPEHIQSVRNPRFRHWLRVVRRGRLPEGPAVLAIEGAKLLGEALAGGWRPVLIGWKSPEGARSHAGDPRLAEAEALLLDPHLFDALAETVTPQEPLALVAPPDWSPGPWPEAPAEDSPVSSQGEGPGATPGPLGELMALEGAARPALPPSGVRRLAIADAIQDPGNLGTLLRSALAFGFETVGITEGSATAASSKVLRASAGALFRARLYGGLSPIGLIAWLRAHGFLVVILDPRGDLTLDAVRWREPVAIVTGNEAQGPAAAWFAAAESSARKAEESGDPASGTAGKQIAGESPAPSTEGNAESAEDEGQAGKPNLPSRESRTRSAGPALFLRVRIPMAPGAESLNTATAAALAFHAASRALCPFE